MEMKNREILLKKKFFFSILLIALFSVLGLKAQASEMEVVTWEQFKIAINDKTTTVINLKNDIKNPNANITAGTLSKSLLIKSDKDTKTIDFGDSGEADNPGIVLDESVGVKSTLRFENIELKGKSSAKRPERVITSENPLLYSTDNQEKWTVEFKNFSFGGDSNKRIANIPTGKYVFEGTNEIENLLTTSPDYVSTTKIDTAWHKMFEGKEFIVERDAKLNVSIQDMLFVGSLTEKSLPDVRFSVASGADVNIKNVYTPLIAGAIGAGDYFKFYVGESGSDKPANVEMYTETKYRDRVGGAVAVESAEAHYKVTGKSKLDITNRWGPAIVMMSKGGVFDVEEQSILNTVSLSDNSYTLGGTIRFREEGSMTFNIKERSILKVDKQDLDNNGEPTTKNKGAAVRFYGGDNNMIVSDASKVYIHNDSDQVAIQYENSRIPLNSFQLKDANSKVEIKSKRSGGIKSDKAINIIGEKGTEFQLSSAGSKTTTFSYGSGSNLEFNNMLYYDFRNENDGAVFSGSGDLSSSNSDLSVWKKKMELEGDPDRAWTLGNVGLSGSNLDTVQSSYTYSILPSLIAQTFQTTSSIQSYLKTKGSKPSDLSRLSGNNAEPIVDELRIPTDADKKAYGHVSIPEGVEGIRSAWTDEVTVFLEVTKKDGTTYQLEGKTVGKTGTNPGLSVYGEHGRGGMFEIPNKVNGKEVFFEEGDSVKAIKAIRGGIGENQGHPSDPSKDDRWVQDPVSVIDVTPPNKVSVDTKLDNGTKKISGTNNVDGANIYLKVNNEWLKNSSGKLITGKVINDKWELSLPKQLNKGDKVEFFAKEAKSLIDIEYDLPETYTKTPDDLFGNINPSIKTYDNFKGYHDAIGKDRFESSLELVVEDVMPSQPRISKIARALTKDKNGDQKPQTDYDTDVRPEDWKGNITKVNNILSYRIVVQIPGKTGEDKDKILYNANVTDKLPDGLAFDKSKVKVWKYTKGNTADGGMPYRHETDVNEGGTRKFNMGDIDIAKSEATEFTDKASIDYKEDTRMLTVGIGDITAVPETEYIGANEYGILLPGDNIVIEVPTVVTPQAVKSDIKNKATIKGFGGVIETEDPLTYKEVTADSNVAVNPGGKVIGELLIKTAPETITFATTKLIDYNKSIGADKTSLDKPLVVKDTLKDKDWQVNVTLIKDMTYTKNGRDYTLPKSLNMRYKNKNQVMEVGEPQLVFKSDLEATPLGQEEFDISDDWKKPEDKDGIKMKASKIPQAGTYVGTVQWSLENTQ